MCSLSLGQGQVRVFALETRFSVHQAQCLGEFTVQAVFLKQTAAPPSSASLSFTQEPEPAPEQVGREQEEPCFGPDSPDVGTFPPSRDAIGLLLRAFEETLVFLLSPR